MYVYWVGLEHYTTRSNPSTKIMFKSRKKKIKLIINDSLFNNPATYIYNYIKTASFLFYFSFPGKNKKII